MGNCYSSAIDFHDHVCQLKIGGRKDAGTERPPENTEAQLIIAVQLDLATDQSRPVDFRHNGVTPFTREEVVRYMFDNQKTVVKKLLTRLRTNESEREKGKEGFVLDGTFFDGLKQVEGGTQALARQLGIMVGQAEA